MKTTKFDPLDYCTKQELEIASLEMRVDDLVLGNKKLQEHMEVTIDILEQTRVENKDLRAACEQKQEVINSFAAIDNVRREENVKLETKIDTAIEQLNEHIHEGKHHLDDILFELEGGADSFKLELCDKEVEGGS